MKKYLILLGYDYINDINLLMDKYDITCLIEHTDENRYAGLKEAKKVENNFQFVEKDSISNILSELDFDCLITLGWRYILDISNINKDKLLVNVHPAILPEYRGYHPVPHVIINEEKEHGITAHLLTKDVDDGEIISQFKFDINEFSTLKSLQNIVNNHMYKFLDDLLLDIENDDYSLSDNSSSKSKIVAKRRTPQDSEVDIDASLYEVFKRVKASDKDRFPAFFKINGEKVFIEMYRSKEAKRINEYDL